MYDYHDYQYFISNLYIICVFIFKFKKKSNTDKKYKRVKKNITSYIVFLFY